MKNIILILVSLLITSCNDNKKDFKNPVTTVKKSDLAQKKVPKSKKVKINNQIEKDIDTTSYMNDCFDKITANSSGKFKSIEKKLIESKILENNSPEAYRKLYLIHIKYLDIDSIKNTSLFFKQRFKIADEIIGNNLNIPISFLKNPPKCFLDIIQDPKFKNTKIVTFTNLNKEFDNIMALGEVPEEWNQFNSLQETVNNYFEIDFFKNKDVKNMIILLLYFQTYNYTEEDMNNDVRIHE